MPSKYSVLIWAAVVALRLDGCLSFNLGTNWRPAVGVASAQEVRSKEVDSNLLLSAERLSEVFRSAARALKPSVVTITFSVDVPQRRYNRENGPNELGLPPGIEDALPEEMLQQLRRERRRAQPETDELRELPTERVQMGMGSGVIVSADGYVLTNNHVIAGADQLQVELSDGRLFDASVVGTDELSDVAVLRIDATGLVAARLGDSAAMDVGDWVLAIGSPFGLDQTVTAGIISATNRQTGIISGGYEDFLQTDAAINPGNSGGPLVSLRGEVIGINTAINSRSGTNAGVGFAIPANMAARIMDDLRRDGHVVRGLIGAALEDVSTKNASQLKLPAGVVRGALIAGVSPNEPAERAGLQVGDVVVGVNDSAITSLAQLRNRVALTRPGTTLRIDFFRAGQKQSLDIQVGEMTQEKLAKMVDRTEVPALGLVVEKLTPQIASELGADAPYQGGVLVTELTAGPPLQLGIQPGDVIVQVNGVAIAQPAQLIKELADSREFTLLIRRGNRILQLQSTKP